MSKVGDLENQVFMMVERYMASRYSERHGLVTAFDPKTYTAKVTFQPEGQESGWLPIETGHIGGNYGIAIGLTPGDGKATGDQVIVRYQEGDFESGKIVQRVHSDSDQPPQVQSGEMVIWSKFKKSGGTPDGAQGGTGQQLFFKKDGSVNFTDGNGATQIFDGNGNVTFNCKSFTVNASSDIKLISTANALLKGAAAILYSTADAFIKAVGTLNAKSAINKATPPFVDGAADPPISG